MTSVLTGPKTPHFRSILTVVDPDRADDELTLDELGSRIVGMSGRLAAATCRWLLLVAGFDEREGYVRFGLHSTAYWLSHHCGISRRTAVEHVRVARALAAFPQLAAQMSAGRLSYSQVRAISRVPRPGEHQVVDDVIVAAQHGTAAQLETLIHGMRFADRHDHPVPEPEFVRSGWSPTGKRRVSARLEPEHGALLDAALAKVARAEGITSAQALVRMAEWAMAIVADERPAPRELRGDERAALVIHVDTDTYPAENPANAGQPRSAEREPDSKADSDAPAGRVAAGPGLSQEVIERLACAGRVRLSVHDRRGNPLDLGRSSRMVSKKQFRALLQRDKHCTHPGCTSTRNLEGHHVRHWLHGGRTDMDNLTLLCEAHHHAHHDGEFYLVADGPQRWRFFRADGRELLRVVRPDDYADDDTAIDSAHPTEFDAPSTRWDGQHLERAYAVSVLADRRSRSEQRAS